jgi:hypothetical protein
MRNIRRFAIITLLIVPNISYSSLPICNMSNQKIADLIFDISQDNKLINNLTRCQKRSKFLFSTLINNIDPHYIKYADQSLKSNPLFFIKFLPLDYKIIKYAANNLKRNKEFILNAIKSNIEILQYVDPILLDNKEFAKKLINLNPKSYLYLSYKLQMDLDLAIMALKYNSDIFSNIPEKLRSSDEIIEKALISNPFNYQLLSISEQEKDWVQELKILPDPDQSLFFKKYLQQEYANSEIGMNIFKGYKIAYQAKNYANNRVFFQNYPVKWKKYPQINDQFGYKISNDINSQNNWQDKFAQYSGLSQKITEFLSQKISNFTINSMQPISIWEISDQEVIFNLYSIRKIIDEEVSEEIINVSSLTAIAIWENDQWRLNIVDGIYDSNIKTNIAYKNGHKRFYIWDLYEDEEYNVAIIFKIEDEYSEYFKIYQEDLMGNFKEFYQLGGYYEKIIIDPDNSEIVD